MFSLREGLNLEMSKLSRMRSSKLFEDKLTCNLNRFVVSVFSTKCFSFAFFTLHIRINLKLS